jgi:ABC-type dipeptide/oligopeptide/nickel transport system permease component
VTSSLIAFVARRAAAAIVLVAVVSTGAFVLTRLAPGDEVIDLRLNGADEATIAKARARLGLDRPFATQVGDWVSGLARFDLGRSTRYDAPVAPIAREKAANTALLAAVALAMALIGLPLGVLTGARPGGWLAIVITPLSVALVACPPIVGALALLWFAVSTRWLSIAPGSLGVPALALALPLVATLERLQSQATTEALRAPDVLAAAARGLSPTRVLWRHAARQSLRPVLGVAGVLIGSLFSGSLAVEVVTGWPGLGRLMYEALEGRDVFLAAGCALVGATVLAAGNLAADIARAVVDPRTRLA